MCPKKGISSVLGLRAFIYEAPFVTIGSELWENTGDNPKKALDNYYIDRWRWPNVQKRA